MDQASTLSAGAPTLEMVAREAGVSRATVSRVVNGSPKVRPDIVTVVNAAIDRLNYVPNRAARSLVSRRTQTLALIVPEDTGRFFADPYFAAIVHGMTKRLDESEYLLNLLVSSSDPRHKTARYLRSGALDGAFIVSHHSGDEVVREAASALPIVFGGRPVDDDGTAYYFDVDNVAAGEAATKHLLALGRRRIGTISGPTNMPAAIDRLEGYRRAMADAGLPGDAVETGDFSAAVAIGATRRLLDRVPDLDGLFVASDLMATGAISVLVERGLRVPDDVAIVGFDDSPAALQTPVPLTTIRQPSEAMGAGIVDLMLRRLAGEPDLQRRNILPTELVRRASA